MDFEAYPEEFRDMIETAFNSMDALSARLENGEITPGEWFERMMSIIERSHSQAMLLGSGLDELTEEMELFLERQLAIQAEFLAEFQNDYINNGWDNRYTSRARLYALSSYSSFSHGDIIAQAGKVLPLPAYPAEGTQCLSNCKCNWEIEVLDFDAGNFDAYWRLGTDDNCQTCLVRQNEWSPARIRNGELLT
jgi:hypothetical protein